MAERLERFYNIGGQYYWEHELPKPENRAVYHINGNIYTQKQIENMPSSIYYKIGDVHYPVGKLKLYLSRMGPWQSSTYRGLTRRQVKRALSLLQDHTPMTTLATDLPKPLGGTQEPGGDGRSEVTQTAPPNEGIEMPPVHKDDKEEGEGEEGEGEEDDLIAKALENLQIKMEAAKRHKKLAAEVEKLRKLLVDKEAELIESEKVLALEFGQVKSK